MELGLSDAPPPRSSILEPLRSTSCDTSLSARAHRVPTQGAGQELEGRSQAEERWRADRRLRRGRSGARVEVSRPEAWSP